MERDQKILKETKIRGKHGQKMKETREKTTVKVTKVPRQTEK